MPQFFGSGLRFALRHHEGTELKKIACSIANRFLPGRAKVKPKQRFLLWLVHFSVIYNSRAHFGFAKRGRNHTRLHEAPFRFRFELRASRAPAPRFRFELRASRAPTPRVGFGFVSSGARFRETGFDFLVLSVSLSWEGRTFLAQGRINRGFTWNPTLWLGEAGFEVDSVLRARAESRYITQW